MTLFVLVLIGAGAGWYYRHDFTGQAPTEQEKRIADRQADPAPLTEAELFPSGTVSGAGKAYKVLKTQSTSQCAAAAGGTIVETLTTAGCSQVVRATLTSPDDALVVTAGIFNLDTQKKAERAAAAIKTAVDKEQGRFGGLVAGGASNIMNRASASLAWDVRGHYVVYCVVVKADGSAIDATDTSAQTVRKDVVGSYLGGVVLQKRATVGDPPASPATQPS